MGKGLGFLQPGGLGRVVEDNARPEAGAVYAAVDMPWAKLVGQIARAYGK